MLDVGRLPVARFPYGDFKLSASQVTYADIDAAVGRLGEFGGDNRAGIDRCLHRISCMRNRHGRIVGLTCRAGRVVPGTAELVGDLVREGQSVLLLGKYQPQGLCLLDRLPSLKNSFTQSSAKPLEGSFGIVLQQNVDNSCEARD